MNSKVGKPNPKSIHKMNENLKIENPADFQRRVFQAEVLSFEPEYMAPSFRQDMIYLENITYNDDYKA